MTPEQKAKVIFFLKGLALAMLTAGAAYASTHWHDIFGVLTSSAAIGYAAGIVWRLL